MQKPSVLLVDDNVDFPDALLFAFENHKFQIFTASDGEEALVNTVKSRPDLIVLDIMLHKKDGYAVCHELKTDKQTSSILKIVLTSLGKKNAGKRGCRTPGQWSRCRRIYGKTCRTRNARPKGIGINSNKYLNHRTEPYVGLYIGWNHIM